MARTPDAVIVGSGPNGLAAAVTLTAAGLRVLVIEGAGTVGGGCRTEELTRPGVWHDVCAAAHPLAVASAGRAGARPPPRVGPAAPRLPAPVCPAAVSDPAAARPAQPGRADVRGP